MLITIILIGLFLIAVVINWDNDEDNSHFPPML